MKQHLLFFACFLCAFTVTAQVTQINNNNSLKLTYPLGNTKTIAVSDIDSSIWVTDGTASGTLQISPNIKFIEAGGLLTNKLIFSGYTDTTGIEVFITDGTPAGTLLVKNIVAGASGSDPVEWVPLNGFYYFTAATPAQGRELWRTDGTQANTNIVKDIIPGPQNSNGKDSFQLFSNGSYLLFAASTASNGVELYKSDGTLSGTNMLMDINPLADSSNPREFFAYNNIVLFFANDSTHGEELWKTDGTPGGTSLVKDIHAGAPGSAKYDTTFFGFPFSLSVFNGFHLFNNRVYFDATDGNSRGEVWSTDGTTGNTNLLKNIIPGNNGTQFFIFITNAVNLPSKFIFPVADNQTRSELWESDGTPAGTKLFKPFALADSSQIPINLLSYNFNFANGTVSQSLYQGNKFFFIANDSIHGRELWISDGVDSFSAHTRMVKDIWPGTANGISSNFTSYVYTTSGLYFPANDSTKGNELWKTDGTGGGTAMVADINPNVASSDPELPFYLINGKIIFNANEGDNINTDLYVVDGNFTALPISLAEFTVRLQSADAVLKWSTLNEVNTKYFIIQRSFDGHTFETIGTMPAAENSSIKHDYYYTDIAVANKGKNIIYYRILSADKDGKSQSTNVINIRLKNNEGWNVKLLSNPVTNFANVMMTGISGDLHLLIKDVTGKTVYNITRKDANGQINIPLTNLQSGIYILSAINNNERKSITFMKQ